MLAGRMAALGTATLALVVALAGGARAQEPPAMDAAAPWDVSFVQSSLVSAAALAGVWGFSKIDVRPSVWPSEFLPWDEAVKANFSASAAALADGMLTLGVALPIALTLGGDIDGRDGDRLILYGQALSLNLLVVAGAKALVQRPRPYVYSKHPLVAAYTKREGSDAYLSFYSGHASTAFTAAVAGSYLYGMESTDKTARGVVWGTNLTVAALTANLRVRAGKHFLSDIGAGALVGASIGLAVPLLHATDGGAYVPDGGEWAAMASGLILGTVLAYIVPMRDDVPQLLGEELAEELTLRPITFDTGGAGIALSFEN